MDLLAMLEKKTTRIYMRKYEAHLEYKRWQDSMAASAATFLPNSAQALPIMTCLEDHIQLNNDLGANIL